MVPATLSRPRGGHLVWCPGPRSDLRFIDQARHTLLVQNERYQDAVVIERIVRAARRGVKVQVIAGRRMRSRRGSGRRTVGLRILDDVGSGSTSSSISASRKMLLADGVAAIVARSISLAQLGRPRELAIEVRDDHVVERLQKVARTTGSTPTARPFGRSAPRRLEDRGGEAKKLVLVAVRSVRSARLHRLLRDAEHGRSILASRPLAARGLLVVVVALNLGIVYLNVLLNQWNNGFYNALQDKNYAVFAHQLVRSPGSRRLHHRRRLQLYLNQMLQIRWRRWLTERYLQPARRRRLLPDAARGGETDNPISASPRICSSSSPAPSLSPSWTTRRSDAGFLRGILWGSPGPSRSRSAAPR